jgi:hypothetical protein
MHPEIDAAPVLVRAQRMFPCPVTQKTTLPITPIIMLSSTFKLPSFYFVAAFPRLDLGKPRLGGGILPEGIREVVKREHCSECIQRMQSLRNAKANRDHQVTGYNTLRRRPPSTCSVAPVM